MMSPHRLHCVRLQATAFPLHCTHGGKVVSGGGYAYHKLCYSTNSSHCITKYCNLHRRTKMTRSDQQMAEIQNLLSDPIKHTHISHDRMDLNRFDGLRECDKTVCVMQISRFPSIIRKLHACVCVCDMSVVCVHNERKISINNHCIVCHTRLPKLFIGSLLESSG